MAKKDPTPEPLAISLGNLPKDPGTHQEKKRLGRGAGSHGRYSSKGMNGQKQRSGRGKGPVFNSGAIPLYRRLPKHRGFNRDWADQYQVINLADLDRLPEGTTLNPESLKQLGLIRRTDQPVKLLGNGSLSRPVTVTVHAASASAKAAVEAVGGQLTFAEWHFKGKVIERPKRGGSSA